MRYKAITVDQEHLLKLFKHWGIAWVLCGLLFGLDRINSLDWLRGGFERGFGVIDQQVIRITSWILTPITFAQTAWNRTERIADLEERLAFAAVEKAKLTELESKVITLEALSTQPPRNAKASKIIRLVNYGDRIALAAGTADGIQVGQIVTDKSNVLLGRVRDVGRYLSEVEVLDDLGSRVSVQVSGGSAKGVVEGKGGRAELTGVLQSEPLMIHDVLITSGIDERFPPGIVVGQMMDLIGKPEDVTKGGIVELLAHRDEWVILW